VSHCYSASPSSPAAMVVSAVVSSSVELIIPIVPSLGKIIRKSHDYILMLDVCAFHGGIVLKLDP
jgi:hypothetical protein